MFHRNRNHEVPGLNTASLPDLIFTVLFFFMIVTHMRTVPVRVKYQEPEGRQLARLVNKSTTAYIYIGLPTDDGLHVTGTEPVVQLNDKYVTPQELRKLIAEMRERMTEEERQQMTVSIRADKATPMHVIHQVRESLRQAGALNVHYGGIQEARNP